MPHVIDEGQKDSRIPRSKTTIGADVQILDHSTATVSIPNNKCYVRINGEWLDLTAWASAHPAGPHWILEWHTKDATEVFHAFHSTGAHTILSRLPRLKDGKMKDMLDRQLPACSSAQIAFRALRKTLQQSGWFQRDPLAEAWQLFTWLCCASSGLYFVHSGNPWLEQLAFIPLGLSLMDACWLAHDYIHGRGPWCTLMRNFGGWAAGFSASMWSDKHNMHHAATNEMGRDEDLSSGPLLWLWAPDPSKDKPWRRWQPLYASVLFSLLHVVWRIDSVRVVVRKGLWSNEGLPMLVHYVLALTLIPWQTYLAAMLLGGFLTAQVVTCTHQSEELLEEPQHDWVTAQFLTTRNAETTNPLTEWLWGGMQYQLEHHLFPTMPRYRYKKLIPVLQRWAKEQGLEYRYSKDWAMFVQNFQNYARVAVLPAQPGANLGKQGTTI